MKYRVESRLDHNLPVTALQRYSYNIALHLIPALSELDLTSPLTPLLLVRHLVVFMGVPPLPPTTFAPPASSIHIKTHHQRRDDRGFKSRRPQVVRIKSSEGHQQQTINTTYKPQQSITSFGGDRTDDIQHFLLFNTSLLHPLQISTYS